MANVADIRALLDDIVRMANDRGIALAGALRILPLLPGEHTVGAVVNGAYLFAFGRDTRAEEDTPGAAPAPSPGGV